jgi:hypothetical protein
MKNRKALRSKAFRRGWLPKQPSRPSRKTHYKTAERLAKEHILALFPDREACWPWPGPFRLPIPKSYQGTIYRYRGPYLAIGGRQFSSLPALFNPPPKGFSLRRTCETPDCINPDHWEPDLRPVKNWIIRNPELSFPEVAGSEFCQNVDPSALMDIYATVRGD